MSRSFWLKTKKQEQITNKNKYETIENWSTMSEILTENKSNIGIKLINSKKDWLKTGTEI